MEVAEEQGQTLRYVTVHPDGFDSGRQYPLVILLHGFGAGMHDLAGLAPAIHSTGYIYVCPNAPLPVQTGPGATGYAWSLFGQAAAPEQVEQAEVLLHGFFDEVMERYRVPPGQALLGGFSQGGRMTLQCGLTRPDLFAGLVALSAVAPPLQELEPRLPPQHTLPIFISHGAHDPLISVETARGTRDFLQRAGYPLEYREYPMAHQITPAVLEDLTPWIRRVLPPLG
jgi:phospholipase/carboxylesterase